MVGGAAMYPPRTIVQNAAAAPNLTTLVAAVKAAGLVETLSGAGPFTMLAPTNAAFASLAERHRRHAAEAREQGRADAGADLSRGRRPADRKAVDGRRGEGWRSAMLTVTESGKMLMVADNAGNKAAITTANVAQSNGMVHVIDHVLMP